MYPFLEMGRPMYTYMRIARNSTPRALPLFRCDDLSVTGDPWIIGSEHGVVDLLDPLVTITLVASQLGATNFLIIDNGSCYKSLEFTPTCCEYPTYSSTSYYEIADMSVC